MLLQAQSLAGGAEGQCHLLPLCGSQTGQWVLAGAFASGWRFAGGGSARPSCAALVCVSPRDSARLLHCGCILWPLAPTLSWVLELGSPGQAGQGVGGGIPRSCSLMGFEVIS